MKHLKITVTDQASGHVVSEPEATLTERQWIKVDRELCRFLDRLDRRFKRDDRRGHKEA